MNAEYLNSIRAENRTSASGLRELLPLPNNEADRDSTTISFTIHLTYDCD